MTSIPIFDSTVYSEEIAPVISEREYDEVMGLMAAEDFDGYSEWSQSIEVVNESENFIAFADGSVRHKPGPKAGERYGSIEI